MINMENGDGDTMSAFESKSIRLGFVRKVYGILTLELIVTFGFVLGMTFVRDANEQATIRFMNDNVWILITAVVLQLVLCVTLSCFQSPRRTHPWNMILLGVFVIMTTIILCYVTAMYTTSSIIIAVGLTMAISGALTLFAAQTKIDFTVFYQIAFVALILLILMGFLTIWFKSRILELVYGTLGALIFSVYIIIDTQMIIGGHKFEISPEEYILASLTLYLDVVNLFLYLLRIFGSRN